jgi:hypothetical protein
METLCDNCLDLVLSKLKFWEVAKLARISKKMKSMVVAHLLKLYNPENSIVLLPSLGYSDEYIDNLIAQLGRREILEPPYPSNYTVVAYYAAQLGKEVPFIKYITRTARTNTTLWRTVLGILNKGGVNIKEHIHTSESLALSSKDPTMIIKDAKQHIYNAEMHAGQPCFDGKNFTTPYSYFRYLSWYARLSTKYFIPNTRAGEKRLNPTDPVPPAYRSTYIELAINSCFERCIADVTAIITSLPECDRERLKPAKMDSWYQLIGQLANRPYKVEPKFQDIGPFYL